MSSRRLPNWLDAYLQFTAASEAPEHFHFWTAIGTIAAALRRKVYIDQGDFKWLTNFFIVLVAPPGICHKSSCIGIGESLLEELGTIRLGPDATTWQGMIKLHAENSELVPMPDGTFLPMSCITYFASELGALLDFQDQAMLSVLCSLWDGRPRFSKVTAHVGDFKIGNPWVNIIAGVTPDWLADNLPKSMLGGGFIARCVMLFSRQRRHLVAYPKQYKTYLQCPIRRDDLVADLERIAMLKGEYQLSPEVLSFGKVWYEDLDKQLRSTSSEELQNYIGRKQTHVHKVAMALAAARSDNLVIELCDLKRAISLVEALETSLPEMFRKLQSTPSTEKVFKLVGLVRARGSIPLSELYRTFFRTHSMPYAEFEPLLDSALRAGMLAQVAKGGMVYVEATGQP